MAPAGVIETFTLPAHLEAADPHAGIGPDGAAPCPRMPSLRSEISLLFRRSVTCSVMAESSPARTMHSTV